MYYLSLPTFSEAYFSKLWFVALNLVFNVNILLFLGNGPGRFFFDWSRYGNTFLLVISPVSNDYLYIPPQSDLWCSSFRFFESQDLSSLFILIGFSPSCADDVCSPQLRHSFFL
jgi:hypothetical protein